MAFNASAINTRYVASGYIRVLKDDFVKLSTDLITLETFAATSASNAGKWSQLQLAEVTTTPATNIQLFHLDTNGYASTVDNGKWKQFLLGTDAAVAPATNIQLFHINTGGYASTVDNGKWKQLLLSSDVAVTPATNIQLQHLNTSGYASTNVVGKWNRLILDKTVVPGTNIGISDLKTTLGSTTVSAFNFFPNGWNTFGPNPSSAPGQSVSVVPFYMIGGSITSDTGSRLFWWTSVSATSNNLASGTTLGVQCDVGAVQISGGRVFCPVFSFFGVVAADITYTATAHVYQIDEA